MLYVYGCVFGRFLQRMKEGMKGVVVERTVMR